MGFWRQTIRVFQDVTSLGGTARIRGANKRYLELVAAYQSLIDGISSSNAELSLIVSRVRKQIAISRRRLKRAHKILFPLGGRNPQGRGTPGSERNAILSTAPHALVKSSSSSGIDEFTPAIAGTASGVAAAGASWVATQVVANASTGTAVAGLHGAAASNATWAWFGGGSLATGGGGMALGHFVLPGIGTAVAITVSASLAHKKANKLVKACEELEMTNQKNILVLKTVNVDIQATRQLESKLIHWDEYLSRELKAAQRQLLRFGFLSRLWRLLRSFFSGCYYSSDEVAVRERLQKAVERFILEFQPKVN